MVENAPRRLQVRPVVAADIRPLVPFEPEPFETAQDALVGVARRTRRVGILDAEHENAVVLARVEIVVERGPRPADVEMPRRARREAHPDHILVLLDQTHRTSVRSRLPVDPYLLDESGVIDAERLPARLVERFALSEPVEE